MASEEQRSGAPRSSEAYWALNAGSGQARKAAFHALSFHLSSFSRTVFAHHFSARHT